MVSLARQQWPDLSGYADPETVWRIQKEHHAGLIVKSPDFARVSELLKQYAERFRHDFLAVMPPKDKPDLTSRCRAVPQEVRDPVSEQLRLLHFVLELQMLEVTAPPGQLTGVLRLRLVGWTLWGGCRHRWLLVSEQSDQDRNDALLGLQSCAQLICVGVPNRSESSQNVLLKLVDSVNRLVLL